MMKTSFSDANILNVFSGGSLLPGHTVLNTVYLFDTLYMEHPVLVYTVCPRSLDLKYKMVQGFLDIQYYNAF